MLAAEEAIGDVSLTQSETCDTVGSFQAFWQLTVYQLLEQEKKIDRVA